MSDTLPRPVLSGWCSPAALDGLPHPRDHAACQKRLDRGAIPRGCQCPDHDATSRKDDA